MAPRPRRALRLLAGATAGAGGFVLLVWMLYELGVRAYPGNSDNASVVLEGQAISQGHLLLQGWVAPIDSYQTMDALFEAFAGRVIGFGSALMHLDTAVMAALVVVVGILACREEGVGRAGLVAGGLTVGALVAFPSPLMSFFLLGSGFHVSTTLFALLAFVALRRGTFGWQWGVAVLLLALGALGDLEMVAYGIVPAIVAGGVECLRRREWRVGLPTSVAGAAAGVIAYVARLSSEHLGAFTSAARPPAAHLHQIPGNVGDVFVGGWDLLAGTHLVALSSSPTRTLAALHAASAVLVVAAVGWVLVRLLVAVVTPARVPDGWAAPAAAWRLDDLLVMGAAGGAASFVVEQFGATFEGFRYLTASVLLLSVLTGRVVARYWGRIGRPNWTVATAAAGVVLVALNAATVGDQLTLPRPPQIQTALVSWLEAHGLTEGLGTYWEANLTTVDSGGSVVVRPLVDTPGGGWSRMPLESAASWYTGQEFQFLVVEPALGLPLSVDLQSAIVTFGPPLHVYPVGGADVVVWSHPVHMSAAVR